MSSTGSAPSQHYSHRKGASLSSFIKTFFEELRVYFRLFIFIKTLCAYVCVLCNLSFSERKNSHFKKSLLYSRMSQSPRPTWRRRQSLVKGLQCRVNQENHGHVLLASAAYQNLSLCVGVSYSITNKWQDQVISLEKSIELSTTMLITSSPSAMRQTCSSF